MIKNIDNKYLFIVGLGLFVARAILLGITNNFVVSLYFILYLPFFPYLYNYFEKFPKEILLYVFVVFFGELYNVGHITSGFIFSMFMLLASLSITSYISKDFHNRMFSFVSGVIVGAIVSALYFFISAQSISTQLISYRHGIEHFSASSVGFMSSLVFYYGLTGYFTRNKQFLIVVAVIGFLCMAYAVSKSALIAAIIVPFFWLFFTKRMSSRNFILVVIGFGVVYYFLRSLFGEVFDFLNADLETSADEGQFTLSGRGTIWEVAWKFFKQQPLLGYGYSHATDILEHNTYNSALQAHSAYYQSLLSVGIVGTGLLAFYYFRVLMGIAKRNSPCLNLHYYNWAVCMVFYWILRFFTEGSIAQGGTVDVLLFFIISSIIIRDKYYWNSQIRKNI